jgi:hypothetical protein
VNHYFGACATCAVAKKMEDMSMYKTVLEKIFFSVTTRVSKSEMKVLLSFYHEPPRHVLMHGCRHSCIT